MLIFRGGGGSKLKKKEKHTKNILIHAFVNTMIIDKYRYRNGCLTSILRMSKNMQPFLLRFSID